MEKANRLDLQPQIEEAKETLQGIAIPTPIRRLAWLERISGYEVFGKFENQQITGSFKFRGAYNRLSRQPKTRPIIAASAGNHALAIAEAAKLLEIEANLCIPTNASQLKRNRLAGYDHAILINGASLEEATQYAMDLADRNNWDFVSPYNNDDIVAGQATIAIEFLSQIPELDTLIVPVGGGGLVSGIAVAAKAIKPDIKVIGVEPETYRSVGFSLEKGEISRVLNYPTFADGLAVNLEPDSITFDIIKEYVDEIISVSEEEIAAAALALLHHESQMIEASGATGLAAIIGGKLKAGQYGKIGLVFSGGNISTANLSKIMHYPFRSTELVPFLNRFGERLQHAVATKGPNIQNPSATANGHRLTEQETDVDEDKKYIAGRYRHVRKIFGEIRHRLEEYVKYCEVEELRPDTHALETLERIEGILKELTLNEEVDLETADTPQAYNREITEHLQRYRAALHLALAATTILDWRSASYGQSTDTMFFQIESQGNPGVNYNRYESNKLKGVEHQMAQVLDIDQTTTGLLMTSSGMAAYSLIEAYLNRYVLKPDDKILIPQYIYFETDEQVESLGHTNIVRANTHDTEEVIALIEREKPKVVYLDPLTNTPELRMTDIEGIVDRIAELNIQDPIYLVVDGSMMSGEINPHKWAKRSKKVIVLYYDSCSKYLQLGLDLSMGGLTTFPIELKPTFDRLRRNTGSIMYDTSANIYPEYDRQEHQERMKRFARNAVQIATSINSEPTLSQHVAANYPKLETHPDHGLSRKFQSCGGVITFKFNDDRLSSRDALNSFIEIALLAAREKGISLTKGVSFGFSLPRVSAAAAMAEDAPPFLRLSVGDRSFNETQLLIESLKEALAEYIHSHSLLNH